VLLTDRTAARISAWSDGGILDRISLTHRVKGGGRLYEVEGVVVDVVEGGVVVTVVVVVGEESVDAGVVAVVVMAEGEMVVADKGVVVVGSGGDTEAGAAVVAGARCVGLVPEVVTVDLTESASTRRNSRSPSTCFPCSSSPTSSSPSSSSSKASSWSATLAV